MLLIIMCISYRHIQYKIDWSPIRLTALVFHLDEWAAKRLPGRAPSRKRIVTFHQTGGVRKLIFVKSAGWKIGDILVPWRGPFEKYELNWNQGAQIGVKINTMFETTI